MKKGGMVADISETLLELGKSTATQSVKAVGQTFSPVKITEKILEDKTISAPEEKKTAGENVLNSTPLDLEKLKNTYKDEDSQKLQMMRGRLFKLVKEGEEKAIFERKQEEEERKRNELMDEQEKKKQQQAQAQELPAIPKGKERKSIMGAHKKKADLSHVETKPSVSKG